MAESILDDIFAGVDGIAKELISLLGADATITPFVDDTYNPIDGSSVSVTPDPVPVDVSVLENVTEKEVNGTSILMGDYKCLIPQSDITLQRRNINHLTLLFNGIEYRLVWFDPIFSGQEIAMYKAYFRNM